MSKKYCTYTLVLRFPSIGCPVSNNMKIKSAWPSKLVKIIPKDEQKTKKWDSTETFQLDKILYSFIQTFIHSFANSLSHSLMHLLIYLFIYL